MEGDVQRYFEHGLAESTKKTYQAGINKFVNFCAMYNLSNPLPVSQSVLCLFITYLANLGLAYGTIKTYLAAIRYLHISRDLPEPRSIPMPKLSLVERGIRRMKSSELSGRQRLPITPSILRQIRALWSTRAHEFDIVMLWAACCTAFFGFFRMGEITSATTKGQQHDRGVMVDDVAVDNPHNPTMIKIHLRRSKTDQYGKGVDIYMGRTGEELCPVSALLAYLAIRGNVPGPLFRLKDGRFLTKDIFIAEVRAALAVLGLDSSTYAGHSFRIGAATTAAEIGIEDSMIKMLGRWDSSAYQLYVRASRQALASVSQRLVSPQDR